MQAVAAYRKTFPSKQDVIDNTPDPAVKEMILRAEQLGINTVFDRFDAQQPQCSFGLSGSCCRICTMGPCRITPKSPRGVCGADVDLIVSRQLLRGAAAGAAQHGMHAREVILSLKWAAEGKLDVPIVGEYKIRTMAEAFGIKTKNRQLKISRLIFVMHYWKIYLERSQANTKRLRPVHLQNDRKYGKIWIFFRSVHTIPVDVRQVVTGRVL